MTCSVAKRIGIPYKVCSALSNEFPDGRESQTPNDIAMSFITIYETKELSEDLTSLLTDIHENVNIYTASKSEAQRQRMLIIGKVVELSLIHI